MVKAHLTRAQNFPGTALKGNRPYGMIRPGIRCENIRGGMWRAAEIPPGRQLTPASFGFHYSALERSTHGSGAMLIW
jgi:hypothetical protein